MLDLFLTALVSLMAVATPVMPDRNNGLNIVEAKVEPYLEVKGIVHKPDDYVLDITDTLSDSVMDNTTSSAGQHNGHITDKEEIKQLILKEFPDEPIMSIIASCESGLVHYTENGEVLRGREVITDIGLFQVALSIWGEELEKAGIDPFDLMGNIKAARYIYDRQRLNAWYPSFPCWKRL